MKKNVTRRDFCNGVIIGTGVNVLSPLNLFGQSDLLTNELGESFSNYPPMLNGMRGSHQGSFEVAHALAWTGQKPSSYKELNEKYDLVIVGAGISGLATAWFYQQKMGQDARILLLDNHDDFGGHQNHHDYPIVKCVHLDPFFVDKTTLSQDHLFLHPLSLNHIFH